MQSKQQPTAKKQDRLAINASFDDVIGVSVNNISTSKANKISPAKSPSTSKPLRNKKK